MRWLALHLTAYSPLSPLGLHALLDYSSLSSGPFELFRLPITLLRSDVTAFAAALPTFALCSSPVVSPTRPAGGGITGSASHLSCSLTRMHTTAVMHVWVTCTMHVRMHLCSACSFPMPAPFLPPTHPLACCTGVPGAGLHSACGHAPSPNKPAVQPGPAGWLLPLCYLTQSASPPSALFSPERSLGLDHPKHSVTQD